MARASLAPSEDLERHHPRDPSTTLHWLAPWLERRQRAPFMAGLEDLRRKVGSNPYLDPPAADFELAVGEHAAAAAAARKAIEGGFVEEDAFSVLLPASLLLGRHEDVLATLIELDTRFEVDWGDLSAVEEYAAFVASPAHERRLAHLGEKRAGRRASASLDAAPNGRGGRLVERAEPASGCIALPRGGEGVTGRPLPRSSRSRLTGGSEAGPWSPRAAGGPPERPRTPP